MRGQIPNDELTKLLKQTAKQHMNSFQPRPKKGRRQRRGNATPAPAATEDELRGYSYRSIPKATGVLGGPRTPGVGLIKLYIQPTGPAGTPWQPQTDPVTAENWMEAPIAANKPIFAKKSRVLDDGTTIYSVWVEGCKEIPSG